jgi:hypothetical protein
MRLDKTSLQPCPRERTRPVARSGARSGARRAPEVVERELAGRLAAALGTMVDVPPGPQQARPLGIEQYDEGLRHRVDVETEVGAPPRGCGVAVQIEALQDAPKAHPVGIEQPSAVARLQDERFHDWIIAQKRDDQPSAVLRLHDDRSRVTGLPRFVR